MAIAQSISTTMNKISGDIPFIKVMLIFFGRVKIQNFEVSDLMMIKSYFNYWASIATNPNPPVLMSLDDNT